MNKKHYYGTLTMITAVFLLCSFWFGLIFSIPNHGNTLTAAQLAMRQEYAVLKFLVGAVVGCFLGITTAKIHWSDYSAAAPTGKRVVSILVLILLLPMLPLMKDLGYKYHFPWALSYLPFSLSLLMSWVVGFLGKELHSLFAVDKSSR